MSNHYPSWWDTTITIYNKYQDPLTSVVTWYRFIVSGCFWQETGDKITLRNRNSNSSTVLDTANIICRIPIQDAYLPKHLWIAKANDDMSNYFTLGVEDIIVKGEVEDTINEYQSGSRSSDLLKKYKALQGCLQIERFSDNTGGGRGNEHYYVRGI